MKDKQTWIHFLGICGRGSAGMARVMKKLGYKVTGSDQGAYPPMSDYLDRERIEYFDSYHEDHVVRQMDMVVIGGNTLHVDPNNVEVAKARELGLKIVAWPELLGQYVMKRQNIVVAGTYGKTTTTALLVKMLEKGGLDPSYMIGEAVLDFQHNCDIGKSEYSVFEGDEHPTLGYSDLPKFNYFPPKYLVIHSAMWDHANIYPTRDSFVAVFRDLVSKMPTDGFIVADWKGENLQEIMSEAKSEVIWFNKHKANSVKINRSSESLYGMQLEICLDNKQIPAKSRLFGRHNANNILAAALCARKLGVSPKVIGESIEAFEGIKGRLELRYDGKVKLYHDVGQHPGKARGAIEALRWKYPKEKILVVLDPQASVLHDRLSLDWYDGAFDKASEVMVTQIAHRQIEERVSGGDIVRAIRKTQFNANYYPDDEAFINSLKNKIDGESIVLVLTSGGFRGLWGKLEEAVRKWGENQIAMSSVN